MGVTVSKEQEERVKISKRIDHVLDEEQKSKNTTIKLLLLGTAECGKSTVLKQMKIIHSNGFNEQEVNQQKSAICNNIVSAMNKIIKAMSSFQIPFEDIEREADAVRVFDVQKLTNESAISLDDRSTAALKRLWNDCGVQECFARGAEYQLLESTKYFMDNLHRISRNDYVPNEQDILRARITTTGITEFRFKAKDSTFRIFDVGGQRSERRKWIHCFDDVDSIIFITSLSEYNMVLAEDGKTNRTHESLMLFETICNCQYFANTSMILFLNKTDLFAAKIQAFPLTIAFPDYKGDQTYDEALTYMENKFVNVKTDQGKHIYVHRTCATDTRSIQFVFDACFDIIFSANMKRSGLF